MAYAVFRHTLGALLAKRVQVEGLDHLPPQGPYIIAANHQSYLDPPMVWLAVVPTVKEKLFFVTTEYVWRALKKVFGQRGLRWMGIVPMLKEEKAKVVNLATEVLTRGDRLVIFPEGTRNKTGQPVLLPGKTGAARLAHATGAPIVPVGIVAPVGLTTGQAIRNFFFSRQTARVILGEPFRVQHKALETMTKEELVATTQRIMQAIGELSGKTPASL